MNRGLALALLILAFAVALIGADTVMISEAVDELSASLALCEGDKIAPPEKVALVRHAFEENRFLFSVSVPLAQIEKCEDALCAMEVALFTKDESAFASARAEAVLAIEQIKRSALFSFEQIF